MPRGIAALVLGAKGCHVTGVLSLCLKPAPAAAPDSLLACLARQETPCSRADHPARVCRPRGSPAGRTHTDRLPCTCQDSSRRRKNFTVTASLFSTLRPRSRPPAPCASHPSTTIPPAVPERAHVHARALTHAHTLSRAGAHFSKLTELTGLPSRSVSGVTGRAAAGPRGENRAQSPRSA